MLEMIQFLAGCFPKATEMVNECGQMPLHLACRCGSISLDVIQHLAKKCPEALEKKAGSHHRLLPLHGACWNPLFSLNIVCHMVKKHPEALEKGGEHGDLPPHMAC